MPVLIPVGVLIIVTQLQLMEHFVPELDILQSIRWTQYDWLSRQSSPMQNKTAENLGAVLIDEETLQILQDNTLGYRARPPFPRHIYGRLIRELNAQGAKAVALDILLPDSAKSDSPVFITREEALDLGFKASELPPVDKDLPITLTNAVGKITKKGGVIIESDDMLAVTMRKSGNTILAADLGGSPNTIHKVLPIEMFRTNAWTIANVTAGKDKDGKLRRLKAFVDYLVWDPRLEKILDDRGYDRSKAQIFGNQLVIPSNANKLVLDLNQRQEIDLRKVGIQLSSNMTNYWAKPFERHRVWQIGILLAAKELGIKLDDSEVNFEEGYIRFYGTNGIVREMPIDKDGRFLINWNLSWNDKRLLKLSMGAILSIDALRHSPEPEGHLMYLDLLKQEGIKWKGDYPFKDKLVVVGSVVKGSNLSDLGPTPLSPETFYVSTHWNVANSLILGKFIRRTPFYIEWLVIYLAVMSTTWFAWRLKTSWSALFVLAAAAILILASVWLFARFQYWLPSDLSVLGGILLTYLCIISYRAKVEADERQRIRSIFSCLVSPNVVNELLNAEKLSLEGTRRVVTVMFADVRGFTDLTDIVHAQAEHYATEKQLTPEQAAQYQDEQSAAVLGTINTYLGLVADIVKKHNGTLDKFIGDCVMAYWGAPTPNPNHVVDCVNAALESVKAIERLNNDRVWQNQTIEEENRKLAESGKAPKPLLPILKLGLGINTGTVTVGLMGSDKHFLNYTVFGRDVNLASRLEHDAEGGQILLGEAAYQELYKMNPDLAMTCQHKGYTTVKGFRDAISIYEIPVSNEGTPS